MPPQDDFCSLHTHTHASAFDGLGREEEFFARAAEIGQRHLAITDHGSIRGLYQAHQAAVKAGVHLVPGCELYLADDADRKGLTAEEKGDLHRKYPAADEYKVAAKVADSKLRDRDHVTVWALNDEGLRNLIKLTSWSWTRGYYYKPRVDMQRLIEYGAGLAVSSGCPAGIVAKPLRDNNVEVAIDRAEVLAQHFGDRFYVEIMPHVIPGADRVPGQLVRIADRFGAQVIATQDAHYPYPEDSVAQEVLLCIHTRDKMSNPDRFKFDTRDYWLRTRGEMKQAFSANLPDLPGHVIDRALDTTVAMAERCTAQVQLAKVGKYLAAPAIPDQYGGYDEWLYDLCGKGCVARLGVQGVRGLSDTYRRRLIHELRTIQEFNFAAYFAMVWELRNWSRDQGIACGPGRGSAAGSLVSYLLGITDLDPIKHGLMFERFLAPGRADSLPDIDLDFESLRRDEVVQHLRDQYGEDHVGFISTQNTLGGKRALRDLARVYGIPESEVAPVVQLLVEGDGEDADLLTALNGTAPGRAFGDQYPDVVRVADRLNGQLRDVGMHASGVVVSSVPIVDVAPLETRARKGGSRVPAVAYDMHGTEAVGLVKVDVLGLRMLDFLKRAAALAGVGIENMIRVVDLEDPQVLQAFTDGRFGGIFQFDSSSAKRVCRGMVFRSFNDISAMTALNRPGPMSTGMVAQFVLRAVDPDQIESVHQIYDRICASTYGILVYQEQVVQLARDLAGFSPVDADKMRKGISKKTGVEVWEDPFIAGAEERGMDREAAAKLFKDIVGFGGYAFNFSHSACYGALACWSMWLKVHHPEAFYAAFLATEPDEHVQMRMAGEARRVGIPVLPPEVNTSGDGFTLADGVIVASVADLKGVGKATATAIAAGRPYADLLDFYKRTAGSKIKVTSKTFEILAKAGALRALYPHTRFMVANAKAVWDGLKVGVVPGPVDPVLVPDYTHEEGLAVASEVCPMYVDDRGRSALDAAADRLRTRCAREVQMVGQVDPEVEGHAVIVGQVAKHKLWPTDDGKQVLRVAIADSDGSEAGVRVDPDVLDRTEAGLLTTNGTMVIAVVRVGRTGRMDLEACWSLIAVDDPDPLLAQVIQPDRTSPKDPSRAADRADADATFGVEGVLLRVQRRIDRKGNNMLVCTLMGAAGFLRFYVFDSRIHGQTDVRLLEVGARVDVRLEKIKPGMVVLAKRMVALIQTSAQA